MTSDIPLGVEARIAAALHDTVASIGNAASPKVLALANVVGAITVVIAIPNAFEAGQATEQCRKLNPKLAIIARAHSDEEEGHLMHLGANRVIMGAFALSGALAAAIGLILASQTGTADIQMGAAVMLMAFIATVIGGLGSLPGAVLGMGGALFAHSIGVVTPDTFYLTLTFTTLSMLVVGGISSLSGAVLGVVILSSLIQALRWLEAGVTVGTTIFAIPNGLQEITLGIVMVVILAFRPAGIMANTELIWPFARPENPGDLPGNTPTQQGVTK